MLRQRTHWPSVAAALFAGIVAGAAIGKISPALPLLKDDFGLSLIATAWLVSMFNTIAMSSAVFFGIVSDRIGALRFCLFGLLCLVTGGALGAASQGALWITSSRILEGLGFVAITVAAPGLIASASEPGQQGLTLGIWGTYMPAGASAAVASSPLLIGAFGWRGVWTVVAAAAVLAMALLAAQWRQYAGVRSGAPRSLANIRSSLAQPVPWLLGLAFAAYTMQFYTILVWLPTYLLQTRAAEATTSATLTALYIFMNVFGNLSGSWFMHRNVARGAVIGVTFVITTAIYVGVFASGLPDGVRLGCVLAYGLISGNIPAAVLSGGVHYARSPAEVGSIQGLIVQCSNIGIFIASPLVAAAVTYGGGWDAVLWVVLVAGAVGTAAAWAVLRDERAHRFRQRVDGSVR